MWESWPEYKYEHGYFILPAFLFLMWRNWKDVKHAVQKPSNFGMVWIVGSLVLFCLGVWMKQFRFTLASMPALLYGVILWLWGKQVARSFAFPLLLFLFAIPMPGLEQATSRLQEIVTKLAAYGGELMGMELIRSGNQIELSGAGGFHVDEGCSGIRSIVALTLVAFVYGYFTHKEWWKRLIIFASSIPVAMVANGVRIFSILVVAQVNPEFAKKQYHDSSGFVTFGVEVLVLIGISYVLNNGFRFKRKETLVTSTSRKKATASVTAQTPEQSTN